MSQPTPDFACDRCGQQNGKLSLVPLFTGTILRLCDDCKADVGKVQTDVDRNRGNSK